MEVIALDRVLHEPELPALARARRAPFLDETPDALWRDRWGSRPADERFRSAVYSHLGGLDQLRPFRRGDERNGFRLVHYSIQGDHLHALVEADGREALGRGMRRLAIRFAQAVNRALRRTGPVVRDRYHLRVLRTPTQVRNALRYVLLNARRHWAKRRGSRVLPGPVRIDPASSGRWFAGWRSGSVGEKEVARTKDAPAVREPRTWLLAEGWRRLGLLDPAEVPG